MLFFRRVYDNEPESHAANENVTSTSAQQTSTRNVDESLHQEVVKTVIGKLSRFIRSNFARIKGVYIFIARNFSLFV